VTEELFVELGQLKIAAVVVTVAALTLGCSSGVKAVISLDLRLNLVVAGDAAFRVYARAKGLVALTTLREAFEFFMILSEVARAEKTTRRTAHWEQKNRSGEKDKKGQGMVLFQLQLGLFVSGFRGEKWRRAHLSLRSKVWLV